MKWILLPLVVFCIWTLLTAFLAPNVLLALTITKKFYLFLLIPLVPLIMRGRDRALWIYRGIIAVAFLSSIAGIVQYLTNSGHKNLMDRITGFMGHWMTFSGLSMLALICIVAYGLHAGRKWLFVDLARNPLEQLDQVVQMSEAEADIARMQPWGGSPALVASDGLFSFGADIQEEGPRVQGV